MRACISAHSFLERELIRQDKLLRILEAQQERTRREKLQVRVQYNTILYYTMLCYTILYNTHL